eukprot:scpid78815/ scgid26919/ PCTP-like protein; START domain-containing protein 10; Serologically defined colon cancer antigen 28 homolog; StAR-related lipid transfer protein 10
MAEESAQAAAGNPFSDADFQELLRQERSNSAEDGWTLADDSPGCVVWKKVSSEHSVHLVKGFLDFKGIPADRLLTLVYDLQVRARFDELFTRYECVEDRGDHRVTYAVLKFPPGTWNRDLVQFNTKRSEPEEHIVLYKNAVHASRPVDPKMVRAETIFSGTIIRPMADDPNSSTLTLFLQTDVKGWIPSAIINMIATRGPNKWQHSLANFYHGTYKKELESEI